MFPTPMLGQKPKQIVADGDYTNHASVQVAADCGVDFYGSWQDSWKPTERDACGCSGDFLASAFPCDLKRDCFTCPAGKPFLHSFLSPDFPVDGPDRAPLKTAKGAAPSTQQESCSLTTPSFLSRGPQLVGAGRKNRYGKRGGPPGPLINDRPDLIQR